VFGQSLPAQTDVFQQGNVGAQQAILSGLPQIQNALIGGNVDLSQLQPFQVQKPDLGFFSQQIGGQPAPQNQPTTSTQQPTSNGGLPSNAGNFGSVFNQSLVNEFPAMITHGAGISGAGTQVNTGGFFGQNPGPTFEESLSVVNSGGQPSREQVAALLAGPIQQFPQAQQIPQQGLFSGGGRQDGNSIFGNVNAGADINILKNNKARG
jgi:hypothetical protein